MGAYFLASDNPRSKDLLLYLQTEIHLFLPPTLAKYYPPFPSSARAVNLQLPGQFHGSCLCANLCCGKHMGSRPVPFRGYRRTGVACDRESVGFRGLPRLTVTCRTCQPNHSTRRPPEISHSVRPSGSGQECHHISRDTSVWRGVPKRFHPPYSVTSSHPWSKFPSL